ncbi:DUF1073 domain-containing protein [Escherichia coli]|nr:DUF1073 domain-containing protein [Escherichia coli]
MAKKTGRVATADSYDNFVARVGMQQPNQHAASTYRANYTSRNRLLIEWAYRSSWIIGAAVDSKADDMTKKGVRITSEIDPKRRGILESRFDELQLWDCINETLKWSRLYGGAVALILIEGQAPLTPLVLDKVGKGSFKGLAVLDRWMINPQLTRRIKALGPNLGKPEFYDIVTTAQGLPAWTVHHSRLIRMDGVKLPYQQKITENEWGMSIVERIFDRLTSYDSTSVGAAQLAYKAHLRTAKIKKLREIIAMGGKPFEALVKQMELVRQYQTNEGIHGERPDQLYEMIMQSGDVAASRARMIARTEIGRATTALTQARALSVGSEGYWWRIKGAGTRPSHRGMKDKFVRWDNPPTLDGMTGHAGCLPNCDCWPEVQIPEFRK